MTGTAREFHDNGKLSREYEIDDDRYVSFYREYYSNGSLLSSFFYDTSGKIQGPLHQYYPNGNPLKRCWFRDGMLKGWCLMYFEDGRPWKKQFFCGGAPQKTPHPASEGCSDADPPVYYNYLP
jgi:antitoxin component YwqK of YwqJK toxin-antitoxin module